MPPRHPFWILPLACLSLLVGARARADRFELVDGSVILGKLVRVEAGNLTIATAFVGRLDVGWDKVKAFTTDEEVRVGLKDGGELTGRVVSAPGALHVGPPGFGRLLAPADISRIEARAGILLDRYVPVPVPRQPHWGYEAALSLAGRSGPAEKFGGNLKIGATHEGPTDRLVLSAAVDRATDGGAKTADREAGSADYSSNYTPTDGWYLRAAAERDAIRNLDRRLNAAAGYGHKLINTTVHTLEVRVGASLLNEVYAPGPRLLAPALDLSVSHLRLFGQSRLMDTIVLTPTLRLLEDYRVHHESSFDVPLLATLGRLRIGLTNDYTSMAPAPVGRLDTTYFTSLVLEWK
jgi:hypothetical protein